MGVGRRCLSAVVVAVLDLELGRVLERFRFGSSGVRASCACGCVVLPGGNEGTSKPMAKLCLDERQVLVLWELWGTAGLAKRYKRQRQQKQQQQKVLVVVTVLLAAVESLERERRAQKYC